MFTTLDAIMEKLLHQGKMSEVQKGSDCSLGSET